jgi:predicted unusual protein kinase regulating ubiquinone biosynthesis (AarF/ABC1/UbiB family)/nucleotide-binding universal stress UspA family protein
VQPPAPTLRRVLAIAEDAPARDQALAWAAEVATRTGADLLAVTASGAEAGLAEWAAAHGARVVRVADGDAAAGAVDVAAREEVDLIVVASRGMRDRTGLLLHSVANRVSHAARCSVLLVGGDGAHRPAAAPAPPAPDSQLLRRAARIGRVFARHGLRPGSQPADLEARAAAMRHALEDLGPTFAKLGQLLSTRPDLVPPELVRELSRLQDDVAPLDEASVTKVLEEELGVPWEDVFASFEVTPLAAGTIGQVHRATLASGERVVVKVQRPSAEPQILQDLALLRLFVERARRRRLFQQIADLPAVFEHLAASLQRELDYELEAEALERLALIVQPFDRLAVPRAHRELSSRRLLVMEEVHGVPLGEAPPGDVRVEPARQLVQAFLQQVLRAGFFHADPHPGNLRWADGRVVFLDLGMVGELDLRTRELLLLMLLAFWRGDAAFLTELLVMLATDAPDDVDLAALGAEVEVLVARYRHATLSQIELGPLLQDLMRVGARHRVRLPASLALVGKALAQVQLAAAELDPELDPLSLVGGFVGRSVLSELAGRADPQTFLYEAQKLRLRASRAIEGVERLTGARPGRRLQVEFRGIDSIEQAIVRSTRRLALAALAAAALIACGLTAASDSVAGWVPVVLAVMTVLLAVPLALELRGGGGASRRQ